MIRIFWVMTPQDVERAFAVANAARTFEYLGTLTLPSGNALPLHTPMESMAILFRDSCPGPIVAKDTKSPDFRQILND